MAHEQISAKYRVEWRQLHDSCWECVKVGVKGNGVTSPPPTGASAAATTAAAPAAPPAGGKRAGGGKGPAQQPKQTAEEKAAKEAAKAREKLLKAVVKEGGKKGVEIEGASDMGACRCGLRLHPHHPHSPPKLPPPLQAGSTSSAPRSSRPTATSTCSRWR